MGGLGRQLIIKQEVNMLKIGGEARRTVIRLHQTDRDTVLFGGGGLGFFFFF